jgi:erythromycin esterase
MKLFNQSDYNNTVNIIRQKSQPLDNLDALIDAVGDARLVLLGEASHGTHEYYTWRTKITQRLIAEKGFQFIGVESDWPDCYLLNRYIKAYQKDHQKIAGVLEHFRRWPTWMWGNWEVAALAEWLREWNHAKPANEKVGFYGLDVYSLWESLEAVMNYLKDEDPEAAKATRQAIRCFEPYRSDDGQSYALATRQIVPASCQSEVIDLLKKIRQGIPQYDHDREAVFSTEQNALIAVNAEKYYRAMVQFGASSWNVRDHHMTDTIARLLDFHGENSKAIIWEHNTHIGDARATDMADEGLVNVGQLVREKYGEPRVFVVGFGSYQGSVIAADSWGAPMRDMNVPPAREGSWEALLQEAGDHEKIIFSKDIKAESLLQKPWAHRAIGVVYHPEREKYGNYVPSIIPKRYDAFVFLPETQALHAMGLSPETGKVPEAYPWDV